MATESQTPTSPGIDIERQQEEQLRAKYPTVGLKGSAILQKKMQSKVKYFDSGDYNMALSKQMALAKAKHAAASEATNNSNQEAAALPQTAVVSPTGLSEDHFKQPLPVDSEPNLASSITAPSVKDSTHVVSAHTEGEESCVQPTAPAASVTCTGHHHSPPVSVLLTATPSVAQELLQQQVSHSSEEDLSGSKAIPGVSKMSRSESIREVTGDTMATPDNVSAIVRKKSMLNQHGRPVVMGSSPPSGHRPSVSGEAAAAATGNL